MMKFIRIVILLCCFSKVFSQQIFDNKPILDEKGIQIFANKIECHDDYNGIHQSFYALQIVNITNETLIVSWNIDYWIDGICVTCNKPKNEENSYKIKLLPGESVEGTCNKNSIPGTKIYIRELYNPNSKVLTKFEITNLDVKVE
jgi:hypothetical protein